MKLSHWKANDGEEVTARTDPNNSDTNKPTVLILVPVDNYVGVWVP